MKQSKVIGLTGGSGSGKSSVAAALEKAGARVIDCDKIAHENMRKGGIAYGEIVSAFGNDILLENGEINRKKLGSIVFSDKTQLEVLNKITHKHILDRVKELVCQGGDTVVIDAPLLRQTGLDRLCDEVWITDAPYDVRVQRIMERDGISANEAEKRLSNQQNEYYQGGDLRIVTNFETLEGLENFVKELVK